MGESVIIEVRNHIDAIEPASAAAESWLQQHHVSADAAYLVLLTIDEMVTNCIKYAYDDAGEHIVSIQLSVDEQALVVQVVDDGHPFDPLSAPPPDLSDDINQRRPGGLGILLLRNLADDIRYERREATNRLTITKRLG